MMRKLHQSHMVCRSQTSGKRPRMSLLLSSDLTWSILLSQQGCASSFHPKNRNLLWTTAKRPGLPVPTLLTRIRWYYLKVALDSAILTEQSFCSHHGNRLTIARSGLSQQPCPLVFANNEPIATWQKTSSKAPSPSSLGSLRRM